MHGQGSRWHRLDLSWVLTPLGGICSQRVKTFLRGRAARGHVRLRGRAPSGAPGQSRGQFAVEHVTNF